MRFFLRYSVLKWAKLIENPNQNLYPDHDPNQCWIWTGALNLQSKSQSIPRTPDRPIRTATPRTSQPVVKFCGLRVHPVRVLYALHHDLEWDQIPKLRRTCSEPLCINPAHRASRMGLCFEEPEPEPEPVPIETSGEQLTAFKRLYELGADTEGFDASGHSPTLLREYLEYVKDKTPELLMEELE